jgi:hypothetical protein
MQSCCTPARNAGPPPPRSVAAARKDRGGTERTNSGFISDEIMKVQSHIEKLANTVQLFSNQFYRFNTKRAIDMAGFFDSIFGFFCRKTQTIVEVF